MDSVGEGEGGKIWEGWPFRTGGTLKEVFEGRI